MKRDSPTDQSPGAAEQARCLVSELRRAVRRAAAAETAIRFETTHASVDRTLRAIDPGCAASSRPHPSESRSGYSLDKRLLRRDGEVIPAAISERCLRREDGTVESFLELP
ncbi:MAG TPA: hypothetical protein VMU36_09040 [Spirochaetia bacterium]|nr:hypothetical protein [Spirochaetia bacterium]